MASYGINFTNSSGTLSVVVRRAPTAASGGTAITTKPSAAELAKNAKDCRKMAYDGLSALVSDWAVNGISSSQLNLTDTSGTFTIEPIRNGAAASNGTVVTTVPSTAEQALNAKDPRKMALMALSMILSDRAANG